MKKRFFAVAGLCAWMCAVPAGERIGPAPDCSGGCTEIHKVAGEYFAAVRDADGRVLELQKLDLSPSGLAIVAESLSADSSTTYAPQAEGDAVETLQTAYLNASGAVVVSAILYYGMDGKRVDVRLFTSDFSNPR